MLLNIPGTYFSLYEASWDKHLLLTFTIPIRNTCERGPISKYNSTVMAVEAMEAHLSLQLVEPSIKIETGAFIFNANILVTPLLNVIF